MNNESESLKRSLDALRAVCGVQTLEQFDSDVPLSQPPHDTDEWRTSVIAWLTCQCSTHRHLYGSLRCLHEAFCEWEAAGGGVPCTRLTFEAILGEQGYDMYEGMVAGLALHASVEQAGYIHLLIM
jgi:hypothetical protein